MDKPIFTVQDVGFAYPGGPVLFEKLSLSIAEGRITTILGQNGCGKSTLLHLMSRGLQVNHGEISYHGTDIRTISQKKFAGKVAMVHQKNSVPSDMTVEQLVRYGRIPHCSLWHSRYSKHDREVLEWAMKLTDILPLRKRQLTQLSGGQLQRVWIAMALAQETDVIFLDEPTTYLDVRYQIEIMQLISRLNREHGKTVVMVLHDINQALNYSDEIIALRDGRLIAQQSAEWFYDSTVLAQIYDMPLPVYRTEDGAMIRTY
ncbi:MAG: ABC transporter ATP-binding protein [Lachnospiraceae bacterium]|nr:ABC transporter ATP-binding protein [Lachnospiraceae bacterium]MDY5741441.1 ABC transporter ATP-binding protein [Lachnospiraceae bacterium]